MDGMLAARPGSGSRRSGLTETLFRLNDWESNRMRKDEACKMLCALSDYKQRSGNSRTWSISFSCPASVIREGHIGKPTGSVDDPGNETDPGNRISFGARS